MKKKLKDVKDGDWFSISKRSDGTIYKLETKRNGFGYFTATVSGRTYKRKLSATVYQIN